MKITKIKTKAAEIEISKTELFALKQVFNEACHGIRIANFEETIGVSENEAEQFFDYIKNLEKRTDPGSPIIYKIFEQKLKKSSLKVNRRKCCLSSEKYNFYFYMRELDFTKEQLGMLVTIVEKNDEIVARTDADRIKIKKLRQEITLLKEGINIFNHEENTLTSYSFFNKAVKINLSATENNSESSHKSKIAIEFIFEPRKQVNSSNTTNSFTSITTIDEISDFIAEIEDFLKSVN